MKHRTSSGGMIAGVVTGYEDVQAKVSSPITGNYSAGSVVVTGGDNL